MKQYHDALKTVLENGRASTDRTGTGTISHFSHEMRFDLSNGFPLVTTKKVPFKLIVSELLWFLRGDTNIKYLHKHNNHIWDAFADENGDLGPVYGRMWRAWPTFDGDGPGEIDQIAGVIEQIENNPDSRRLIVSAWNPEFLPNPDVPPKDNVIYGLQALPPCHAFFQFFVDDGKLSCKLTQRSADMFLGVPFNIASYSLLTHMIAQVTGLKVGEFIWSGGDCHIYQNHMEQVTELLSRDFRELPILGIDSSITDIDDFTMDSFDLLGYKPHPTIKAPIAV